MDPLTAALNLATAIVALSTRIWDETPKELKVKEAENWAKFAINIGNFVIGLQAAINKGVKT